jgi:DNA mismatch repair ATPase MutS
LAGFAAVNPEYTFPQIGPDAPAALQAEGLGHPLLPPERKVCNDFSVKELGELAVITGSNMAGKSTFIKTIGINLCLAYAGGPVNARGFRFRPLRLHTCIQISDSIPDGFSYFYAEVKCLKRLLERLEADDSLPLLYLIDEIFRGTNNRERLIGSRAYVQALIGARGVGVLATHDLELTSLEQISSLVSNFHFRDHVEDGKLVFDYTLRPGPSPTTNALKIMRMEGLPVEGVLEPGEG